MLLLVALLVGCVNQILISFRNMPFMANDIYSITTAATVAGGYTYRLSKGILKAIVFGLSLQILSEVGDRSGIGKVRNQGRLMSAVVRLAGAAGCVLVLCAWISKVDFQSAYTGPMYLWMPGETYRSSGFLASFIVTWQQMKIPEPEGYSEEKVEEILTTSENGATATTENVQPSVIVIMNESFSDLSVLGPLECTQDHLQFYHSLADDPGTLQYGYDYVSTFGGGTAKTEWEYLTGMTSAFIPGRIAYTQMNLTGTPSLPRVFGQQGYRTVAIHPYLATNYRRDTVYKALGFDEFVAEDTFGETDNIRGYCSDVCDYQKVIDIMEAEESPVFLFNVTMQNHAGYEMEDMPGEMLVSVDDGLEKYPDLVTYESLLKQSDEALEYLIGYLQNCSRPVILCFFGDHLPNLTAEYWQTARYKGRLETDTDLDVEQKAYAIPYLIWSNYDVDKNAAGPKQSRDGADITSPGFMGASTATYAGIRQTEYLSWLLDVRQVVPAVNSTAYYGSDREWHSFEDIGQDRETLNNMQIIQYNGLVDRVHRLTEYYEYSREE